MPGSYLWKLQWAIQNGCKPAGPGKKVPGSEDEGYYLCPAKVQQADAPPKIDYLGVTSPETDNDSRPLGTKRGMGECYIPQAPAMATGIDHIPPMP